jgi:predicted phosphodiesterase
MRLQILSDIHAEFQNDLGEKFITQYLRPRNVDVLIIAGDIGVGDSLMYSLHLISKTYKDSRVLYVPGNHDFYHSSFRFVMDKLHLLENSLPNLSILSNKMVTINGINFVGTTLWFKKNKKYKEYANMLSDFPLIANFEYVVFEENQEAIDFLNWHVNKDSIVITHYMPTYESVPARYKDDPFNMFFVCNMESLIHERKPKMWVHGHTHDSFNYMLGDTHIVCNPLGYLGKEINAGFIPNMIIETQDE